MKNMNRENIKEVMNNLIRNIRNGIEHIPKKVKIISVVIVILILVCCLIFVWIMESQKQKYVESVSYTHLDVYKRQQVENYD